MKQVDDASREIKEVEWHSRSASRQVVEIIDI